MFNKSRSKNITLKIIVKILPLTLIGIIFMTGFGLSSRSGNLTASAQTRKPKNPAIIPSMPKRSKETPKNAKPTPTPFEPERLGKSEAQKFIGSYRNALGADMLNFRKAYDKFFVSDPEVQRYLGRIIFPGQPDICQNVVGDQCEQIIIQKVSGQDLEKYYYLRLEKEYLGHLLWLYAEVFETAAKRGLYKLVETESYNGLQIVLDPKLLKEADGKSKEPVSFENAIETTEVFNENLKKHFRNLAEKYGFVKPILGEMIVEMNKHPFSQDEYEQIDSRTNSNCREKLCRPFENYYELDDLKVYRDEKSGQLKIFDIFFRMKMF